MCVCVCVYIYIYIYIYIFVGLSRNVGFANPGRCTQFLAEWTRIAAPTDGFSVKWDSRN